MRVKFKQNMGKIGNPLNFEFISLIRVSAINLTKNSQFYVRQGDVERLIAQGFLQRLS